ncbi:putative ABC transport system permease protein [Christiangramia gaetbulicola]|uniref:Putative ABC transport system permease protein n=1 Tax=Christiangramia gaetbulicola TaxID=703340 RepID=A0A2T6AM17_9FLAO|nr:ABC transporter permease [Christiangramia gaetbulicola]PTX44862.1 putative ABC transport system permease protein [Christiangramia gaetbulicola]
MGNSFYIAWKYLQFYWGKTLLLILSIALVIFIPLGLNYLVNKGSADLMDRAEKTPLIVGAKGSETELSLSSLYFKKPKIEPLEYREVEKLKSQQLGKPIPLNLEYQVKEQPIVGTTSDYFEFRELELKEGRRMAILGECVLGAKAAEKLNAKVGGSVISSPSGAFDVAGSFPLKMSVVGILAETGTPDDEAVFTDIKTSWVISGKAHGHQDLQQIENDTLLLNKNETQAVASPAVLSYTEITPENINSFHFHGDPSDYPVNAIIVQPNDRKSALMLRGRYENEQDAAQMLVPAEVIAQLVDTMISVRDLLILAGVIIGIACLAILAFVFALSIKLRKAELTTMKHIGASRNFIGSVLSLEVGIVLISAIIISGLLTLLMGNFGIPLIEKFIS